MAQTATIGTIQLLDALNAVHRLGVKEAPLRAAIGVRADVLRDPDARVSTAAIVRLFTEAERLTADAFVGLHAGQRTEPRGPLSYFLLASTSLGQGMRHVARFSPLAIDTLRMRVERGGRTASTIIDPGDRTFEGSHHAIDYLLMLIMRATRRAIDAYQPVEVHVRHGARRAAEALAEAFGCPARVRQPDNRLVYPVADLQAPSRMANPRIVEQIEKCALALLGESAPRQTLRERVASGARALVAAGRSADGRAVARRLGMSGRSLQRGLADEGTSFREVRDAVRWEIVETLLSGSDWKMEAVAFSVGFSDVAAFSKAFKRWAGCPPARYRDQQRLTRGVRPA